MSGIGLGNRTLGALTRYQPVTPTEALLVPGIGTAKVQRYAKASLATIQAWKNPGKVEFIPEILSHSSIDFLARYRMAPSTNVATYGYFLLLKALCGACLLFKSP